MKRRRPKQHTRRCKSGKKVLVNKGIKRKRAIQDYKIARGLIKSKREHNIELGRMNDRLKMRFELSGDSPDMQKSILQKMEGIKKNVRENNNSIEFINNRYFPKNPS